MSICVQVFIIFLVTVIVSHTEGKSCEVGSDCAWNECCLQDKSTELGVCSMMGQVADNCYVKQGYAWSRPEEMVTKYNLCPCETGYLCGSIRNFDPVYGEKGMCTFG